MSLTTTTEDVTGKLHRASCIVAHVANAALEADDALAGETLKAAEDLILAALDELCEGMHEPDNAPIQLRESDFAQGQEERRLLEGYREASDKDRRLAQAALA